ncbi:histidine phosphatase family protein [Ectothiorhodospiraceae bacterium 2226]|nr:histidine phosphatase family protein [Ectothiorhodospiraceae bacterium 2226]
MQLLLVRHAHAGSPEEFAATGRHDGERPLSRAGADKMRGVAHALHMQIPQLDLIASSPYVRALETARILAEPYGLEVVEVPALIPDQPPAAVVDWLREQSAEAVAVVGHEPALGTLASYLLAGAARPFITFKKAGACLIEHPGAPAPGTGTLIWSLTGGQLRKLPHGSD